jgi:hypothetical protein
MAKVSDHDHITGKFLGAAHSWFNLQRRKKYIVPVFFHNLKNFDGHIITRAFANSPDNYNVRPIGQTMERYMQISWGKRIVFKVRSLLTLV